MSGFVSGVFEIIDNITAQLRREAVQELERISNEYTSLQAEYDEILKKREQLQTIRSQAESLSANKALQLHLDSEASALSRIEEAHLLLSQAASQISSIDNSYSEKESLLAQISAMQENVQQWGVTQDSIDTIRSFVQETLPNTLIEIYQRQEKERRAYSCQNTFQMPNVSKDDSISFVSLKPHAEVVNYDMSPWDHFVNRVRVLVKKQDELGGYGAIDLWNELQEIPCSKQNLFMLQNNDRLDAWEAEIDTLDRTIRYAQSQRQELYRSYLSLYHVLINFHELPLLDISEHSSIIQAEHNRLMNLYLESKKQDYLERSFREVFEAHGFEFESFSANNANALEIHFSLNEESGLNLSRSTSGAFEMTFYGKTNSDNVSEEQTRRVTEQAQSFCRILPSITQELKDRGILFEHRVLLPPEAENIQFIYNQEHHKGINKMSQMQIVD